MFLNKGKFKEQRLLCPETIDLIIRNHLENNQTITELAPNRLIVENLLNLNEYLRDKLRTKVTIQEANRDIEFEYPAENYNKYSRELNLLLGLVWIGFGFG